MPFWRLTYHLVWSTRNRDRLIRPGIEDRLHAYLVSKAAEIGVYVYAVNSRFDHTHLVAAIPPKHAIASVVKRLKGASAHDLNREAGLDYHFSWQRGYGALSLGERQRPIAEAYVAGQKQHHRDEETNAWLERYAEFDEGPVDTGIRPGVVPPLVHEKKATYHAWGKPPF